MYWQAIVDNVTAVGDDSTVWGAIGVLIGAAGAALLGWLRKRFGKKS